MTLCGWFKSDEQFITAAEKCCTSWIGNMETAEATSLGIKHNWIHIILDLWVQSQWTRIALLNGKVSFESRISIFKNKQFSMRWLTTVVGKKKEKKSNTRTFLRKISHQFHYSHAADIFANLYIYTNIMFIYTFFFLHLDGLLQLQTVKLQQKGGETDRDTQTHKHAHAQTYTHFVQTTWQNRPARIFSPTLSTNVWKGSCYAFYNVCEVSAQNTDVIHYIDFQHPWKQKTFLCPFKCKWVVASL